jgi:uncharacterized membrane protein YkvA (DUF1232 family)
MRGTKRVNRLRRWAHAARRDVLALYLAGRDPRVPWFAKALALAAAAYALSPIDLIPDFIPVLGQLDDLILLPLAVLLIARLLPPALLRELRDEADRRLTERPPSSGRVAVATVALVVALVWIGGAVLVARALGRG